MYSSSFIPGLEEFQDEVERLRRFFRERPGLLEHVDSRWSNGEAINISLEEAEPLIIRYRETRRIVYSALKRLDLFFNSRYENAKLYAIISEGREYGTGKTQILYFLMNALKKRGIHVKRLIPALEGSPPTLKFDLSAEKSWQVTFIDELDLLVRSISEEAAKHNIIAAFANRVINFIEYYRETEGYKQAVVLVMSQLFRDEVEKYEDTRFGRRIADYLVVLPGFSELRREDVYWIFVKTSVIACLKSGLISMEHNINPRILNFLSRFAKDYALFYWKNEELALLTVGVAISKAYMISRLMCSALSRSDYLRGYGEVGPTDLGKMCENIVREALLSLSPITSVSVSSSGGEYKVTVYLDPKGVKVGRSKADMTYIFTLGMRGEGILLGKVAVEVTAEKKLSSSKRRQISELASRHPVMLVYLYRDETALAKYREEVESLGTVNQVNVIGIPYLLVKYPALLGVREGVSIVKKIILEKKYVRELIGPLLSWYARQFFYRWMSRAEYKAALSTEDLEERRVHMERSFWSISESILNSLCFSRKRRGCKSVTRRKRDKIKRVFADELADIVKDELQVENIVDSVLREWASRRLGRIGNVYFMKEKAWSDETAREVIINVLKKYLQKTAQST